MTVVALSAAAVLISDACVRRSPVLTGRLLQEQVTITRDTLGVPHILAETEEAAAFCVRLRAG